MRNTCSPCQKVPKSCAAQNMPFLLPKPKMCSKSAGFVRCAFPFRALRRMCPKVPLLCAAHFRFVHCAKTVLCAAPKQPQHRKASDFQSIIDFSKTSPIANGRALQAREARATIYHKNGNKYDQADVGFCGGRDKGEANK